MATTYLIAYCVLVALAALAGGAIPMLVKLTHRRMQVATSLIGGFMLGVALLHLLPHAAMAVPVATAVGWMVVGLLAMFFLERFFSYHHHTAPGDADRPPVTADPEPTVPCDVAPGSPIDHTHSHAACHDHDHGPGHLHAGPARLSWAGVGVGLTVHSLINGAALAAAVAAEAHLGGHGHGAWLPGLAVFLVVALHKPFDSMTLLTLMTASGMSSRARLLVNVAYACCVPVGAAIFALGLHSLDLHTTAPLGYALAFTAGMFLCVALADLLPEVQFHQHDKLLLSGAMLLGLALAWGINALEATVHDHDHHDHSHQIHDHGHHEHDHHGHAH
jgi:zinc and cadmium transporter